MPRAEVVFDRETMRCYVAADEARRCIGAAPERARASALRVIGTPPASSTGFASVDRLRGERYIAAHVDFREGFVSKWTSAIVAGSVSMVLLCAALATAATPVPAASPAASKAASRSEAKGENAAMPTNPHV